MLNNRRSCTDSHGNFIELTQLCDNDYCYRLAIKRLTPDGALMREPVEVADVNDLWSAELVCNRAGDVAVLYEADDCPYVATFASDDTRLASFRVAAPLPCPELNAPSVRMDGERRLLTTWVRYSIEDGADVMAQRHAADGAAVATPVVIIDDAGGANYALGSAIDGSGYALVAWQHEPYDATVARFIMARALDPLGRTVGAPFRVSTGHLDYGTEVIPRGNGVFFVIWEDNTTREGRVARRVSLDTEQVAVTTTTTLPPPEEFPAFQPPVVLAAPGAPGSGGAWGVFEGIDATWTVGSGEALIHTPDDGRRWGAVQWIFDAVEAYDLHQVAFGSDGSGGWLSLLAPQDRSAAYLVRSYDDGRTWTDVELLASWEHISEGCSSCHVVAGAIAHDAEGNVVIVWGFHDSLGFYDDAGNYYSTALERIYAVASHDGGLTWGPLTLVSDEQGNGSSGLALATGESGTWVLVWIDTSPHDGALEGMRVARSTDDGRTWSQPGALAADAKLAGPWHPSSLQLAAGPDGEYVALFTASLQPYEADADVFALRSVDAGKSWGAPVPVNAYAAHDGGNDFFPAIATDGSGRWLALWSALEPLGSVAFDRDVVGAISADAGATWSWPVRIDAAAVADSAMDLRPRLAADERDVWLAAWTSGGDWYDSSGASVVAVAGDRCGDGSLDVGENCDDGNAMDDDGCDHNCTATRCGNGVVTPGEPCDDGNDSNEDSCLEGCVLPTCGDGHVWQGVEECDDRNHYDLDGCLGDCRLPYCGDGYVRDGEECDDANADNHDACTDQCSTARCLDGYVQAGEECDDGNRIDHDYCTDECRIARCGDGEINADEACDPVIESQAPFCTDTCVIADRCGDSDANGEVTASDARRILKTAVDGEAPCPRSVCEIDGNERITVTDAKMALHIAVGLDVHARCPIDSAPEVVFFLRNPVGLGALQLFIDYSASGGLFLGTQDRVACEFLVDATLASFNNVPALGHLRMGIISIAAFTGPDLARCPFAPVQGVPISMAVTVEDASAPDLTPITPFPEIGYRIE